MAQKTDNSASGRHGGRRRRNRKPIRRALRRPFEWLGILLGMLVFTNLTHRLLFALCDFLGAVMFFFDRKGRALSLTNLRAVRGVASSAPPTRREKLILKRSYRNMARTIGHQVKIRTARKLRKNCETAMPKTARQ